MVDLCTCSWNIHNALIFDPHFTVQQICTYVCLVRSTFLSNVYLPPSFFWVTLRPWINLSFYNNLHCVCRIICVSYQTMYFSNGCIALLFSLFSCLVSLYKLHSGHLFFLFLVQPYVPFRWYVITYFHLYFLL